MSEASPILRFDVFELDTAAVELRKQGDRIKLPPQPFRVLELLVRHGGEVVTRSDIRERIQTDSFVLRTEPELLYPTGSRGVR